MLNDMLKLSVDLAFPVKKGQPGYEAALINKYEVEGYSNEENMWELIC